MTKLIPMALALTLCACTSQAPQTEKKVDNAATQYTGTLIQTTEKARDVAEVANQKIAEAQSNAAALQNQSE